MAAWLGQNWGTILVLAAVAAVVAWIVAGMVKKRKKGVSACGCGCANCPMSGQCHPKP